MCCSGLHPSQQLMKYDGVAGTQNDVAQRLTSQGSADSGDSQHRGVVTTPSDPGSDDMPSPADYVRVDAEKPAYDLSELYMKPRRTSGYQQEAEPSAANEQIAAYPYEDQSLHDSTDRKLSLTGDLTVLSFPVFLNSYCNYYCCRFNMLCFQCSGCWCTVKEV